MDVLKGDTVYHQEIDSKTYQTGGWKQAGWGTYTHDTINRFSFKDAPNSGWIATLQSHYSLDQPYVQAAVSLGGAGRRSAVIPVGQFLKMKHVITIGPKIERGFNTNGEDIFCWQSHLVTAQVYYDGILLVEYSRVLQFFQHNFDYLADGGGPESETRITTTRRHVFPEQQYLDNCLIQVS